MAGWQRISISRTLTHADVGRLTLKVHTASAQAITFWLDDGQIEEGSVPTAYIETTAGGLLARGEDVTGLDRDGRIAGRPACCRSSGWS